MRPSCQGSAAAHITQTGWTALLSAAMRGRLIASVTVFVAIAVSVPLTRAQGAPGEQVFKERCASCHTGAADSRAPAPEALRSRSPQAIVEALVNGAMRAQG